MLKKILGDVGSVIGKGLGGGIFSTIGRFAGSKLTDYLGIDGNNKDQYNDKHMMDRFIIKQDIFGLPIPIIYGQARISGRIIWVSKLSEILTETLSIRNLKSCAIKKDLEYKYFLSFAILICEGEIDDIERVWDGDEILDISRYKFRLYRGSSDQKPDPLIESLEGIGLCPAFRNMAYIVFEDVSLEDFNNRIPNLSFEVLHRIKIEGKSNTEDLVKSMVLIPGCGEYVYDTKVQYKYLLSQNGKILSQDPINSHNYKKIANSLMSLDQLQATCKNIEWVSIVASWFADSMNIGNCNIFPAVENKESDDYYSEKWRVGRYTRNSARTIGRDKNNNCRYGGTVNDASILRYLDEIKSRGIKIIFYPMIFVDILDKPWRGKITGSSNDIENFFNKEEGYNNFILHYAKLVKGKVDAFIIGSELVNITNIKDENNNFPSVKALISLAKEVKEILGPDVKIAYAADWSEYHHTDGGWYHLDDLWSSKDIDFIGIDAYFPLTSSNNYNIIDEEIRAGFNSGLGYDFYYDNEGNKQALDQRFAWKNIEYWWNNDHYQPNGNKTKWIARSKKIWFTEFGFPSIDKATNQPNIFFDPNSVDSGIPHDSYGCTDFSIQNRAIKLSIEFFKNCEYLENYFLWTWDARPYPAWPYSNVWADSHLWEKGHWVNNKFQFIRLDNLVKTLCKKAQIDLSHIHIENLHDYLHGIVFDKDIKIIDAINLLRISYIFDIDCSYTDKIQFIKRGYKNSVYKIPRGDLLIINNRSLVRYNEDQSSIITSLRISYINFYKNYKKDLIQITNDNNEGKKLALNLPIILSLGETKNLCIVLLRHANYENQILEFYLPISYYRISPTDIVTIQSDQEEWRVRIVSCFIEGLLIKYHGISENRNIYHIKNLSQDQITTEDRGFDIESKICVLDLPFMNQNQIPNSILIGSTNGKGKKLYASLEQDGTENHDKIFIKELKNNSIIGSLSQINNGRVINHNMVDHDSEIYLYINHPIISVTENEFLEGRNLAILGKEIIAYQCVQKVSDNLYLISNLIRGLYGTFEYINQHEEGEIFADLNSLEYVEIDPLLIGQNICFFINEFTKQTIAYQNLAHNIGPVKNFRYSLSDRSLKLYFDPPCYIHDDWQGIFQSGFIYRITITIDSRIITYETKEKEINIDISNLALNGASKTTILPIREIDGQEGSINTINVNF